MTRICKDCEVDLRQVTTNFLETGQVWQAGSTPVGLEGWACPHCGQVRFYAADAALLFSDQDASVVPMTLKEGYGEVLPAALEWSEGAELCAAYSSGDDEDSYLDRDGLCPYWSFTFRNSAGAYLDLILTNRVVERSPYEFEGDAGKPFMLEDLVDSPELIARAFELGLVGEVFTLTLERDSDEVLRATIISGDTDESVQIDPALVAG